MQLKKISTCIVCLFVLLPITAYAQTGLYDLQQGEMAIGIGVSGLDFSRSQDAIGIGGDLSYGISSRTKITLIANMGIIDEERYSGLEHDVPPPVAIGIGAVHVSPLGQIGLDYFLSGAFYTGFSNGISSNIDDPTNKTLLDVRTNRLAGSGGISKRLETNFGWALNPFCGVSYSRSWTRIDTEGAREERGRNRISSGFRGRIGLGMEIELLPAISVIGILGISFEDLENYNSGFSIGLNFH